MFFAYIYHPHDAVRVSGSEVEAFSHGKVMSANFNLVGSLVHAQDLICAKLHEAKNGVSSVVCVVGREWTSWLSDGFLSEVATELDESQTTSTIKFNDKTEPFKADQLSSYASLSCPWACLTWSLCSPHTFLTSESTSNFSLIFLQSLPLKQSVSSCSHLDQLKHSVQSVAGRKLKCLKAPMSVVFQPVSLSDVFCSIIIVGRLNRSLFVYKPCSATKLLGLKHRTKLCTLEALTAVYGAADTSLSGLSMLRGSFKDFSTKLNQSFGDHKAVLAPQDSTYSKTLLLDESLYEGIRLVRMHQSKARTEGLPSINKSKSCVSIKFKGRVLHPAPVYLRRLASYSKP
jgi:hypothetical protein